MFAIDDGELRLLEPVQGAAGIVRPEVRPIGQVPGRYGVGSSLHVQLDGFTALGPARQQVLVVPVMQSLHGQSVAVPYEALGGEPDHPFPSEVHEGGDFGPGPLRRNSGSHPEPGGVPSSPPRLSDREGMEHPSPRLGERDRFAVHVMGRHLQGTTIPVDGRAHHVGDKALQLHESDSVICGGTARSWRTCHRTGLTGERWVRVAPDARGRTGCPRWKRSEVPLTPLNWAAPICTSTSSY